MVISLEFEWRRARGWVGGLGVGLESHRSSPERAAGLRRDRVAAIRVNVYVGAGMLEAVEHLGVDGVGHELFEF